MNETWRKGTGAITGTFPSEYSRIDTASDSGATVGILEKLYLGGDDWCGRSLARRISLGKGQI
jgi:hypothetical protein